ncbi:hypothetical protein TPA0908_33580 [Micromonospora sp. AKA38]|nr:hypothetical protein TPA0908_33580 [Micromonospora sp. AKA38]
MTAGWGSGRGRSPSGACVRAAGTAKSHIANIRAKLGLDNRVGIAAWRGGAVWRTLCRPGALRSRLLAGRSARGTERTSEGRSPGRGSTFPVAGAERPSVAVDPWLMTVGTAGPER